MPEDKKPTTPQQGMVLDSAPLHLKDTQYPWALNAAVETNAAEGNLLALQNDGSNVLATRLPEGLTVVGRLYVAEQNRTLLMLAGAGRSLIGEVLDCPYDDESRDTDAFAACAHCTTPTLVERTPLEQTTQEPYCPFRILVEAACLNFSVDHPVRLRYRITDCGVNLYYTDDYNPRRFTYFDYLEAGNPRGPLKLQDRFRVVSGYSDSACQTPVYGEALDCNKILYHPRFEIPHIRATEVVVGGECRAGMVQAFICYADRDGNALTEYFPSTNPLPLFTRTVTFETNYKTDKAVKITVEGLDQSFLYTHYNIAIAETVDNFTEIKLLGTYPTSQTTTLYTGNEENLKRLTPDEVFFRKAYYHTASNLASANGHLFFSDLAEFRKPNLQRAVLGVRLYWQSVALPEAAYRDPENTQHFRSYMRDEVYALGLEFVTLEGEVLGTYHVPGPAKSYFKQAYNINVDEVIANDDVLPADACAGAVRNKRWQVYNTAVKIGQPHEVTPTCATEGSVWEWGDFAYWESTERYPNNPELWGELCGQPIRHHRFPDATVAHIHDALGGSKSFQESNFIFPIGVRVDHQSVVAALDRAVAEGLISAEDRSRLAGYRLVRGNRVGQKSVVAKGLLFDMWSYDKHGHRYYYPNYPYNDLRNDNFISNDPDTYKGGNNSSPIANVFSGSGRYTFHSPDTHFTNAAIGTELRLETLEYGQSEGYFNLCEDEAKQKFLSAAAVTLTFAAGVAAALSATEEKECVTYTVKSNITQDNTQVSSNTSGTTNTHSYSGSSFAAGTGTILAIPATDSWNGSGDATIQHGDTKPSNLNFTPFGKKTGSTVGQLSEQVETTTKTTCRGTPYQLLSPLSGSAVGTFLQQAIYQGVLGLREMQIMTDLIKALIPLKNLSAQYNSVGRYTNFTPVANDQGVKVRAIQRSAYLEPRVQLINEALDATASQFTNIYVNNWHRERSVYLKIDEAKKFPTPSVVDNSRNTLDQLGLSQDDLGKRVYRTISSYYAAVKNVVVDQYGKLTDVQYLPTGGRTFSLTRSYTPAQSTVFSGDTFINRFALKRKMPFFLQTRFAMNNESDVLYSELGNVGYPNYYFNTLEPLMERIGGNTFGGDLLSSVADLLGVANTRLDAKRQKFFYQSGLIHLYSYGIPYFFCESDINVDMRHAGDNGKGDFYPHQQDLDYWLQEKNVSIREDNAYFYNTTYSKQNRETFVARQVTQVPPACKVTHPTTLIQSEQDVRDATTDRWLIFKANNRFDFPAQKGRITGLDGLEDEKVLVRFEQGSQVFGAYTTLATDAGSVVVGNGGMFQSKPQEFANTPLGFAGSQHAELLSSEFGHVWVDAKRGQVFLLKPGASGLEELAKDGMKNWFKEHLPFQVLRDFANLPLKDCDNNFKGVGLTMAFDKRFARLFITKLDYKKNYPDISYDPQTKRFHRGGQDITLGDPLYFTDRSWTVSYNLLTRSWVSFHSFTPNFYIDGVDSFQSGKHGALWSHGVTNKSYQVYYGKRYPFAVETVSGLTLPQGVLQSVAFLTEAVRYQNRHDAVHHPRLTFNRAWVYNDEAFSGELVLHVRDADNRAQSIHYPRVEANQHHILVTNDRGVWHFNQFFDTVAQPLSGVPFLTYTPNGADKRVNLSALNYYKPDVLRNKIRGRQTRVRLIQDQHSNYKFIYHLVQPEHLNG